MEIVWLIVIGLIAGALARFLVPGKDPMGWLQTIILGIVGSVVGSIGESLIKGDGISFDSVGWIGATVGAIVVLLVWRQMQART